MIAMDIMTAGVASVNVDASVRHAIQMMIDRGVSGLPVVDGDGELVGIVTEGDLMTRFSLGEVLMPKSDGPVTDPVALNRFLKSHSWRVGDVMTQGVLSVSPQASVGQIADIFLSAGVKRVPVVQDGRLLGIVSRRDLLNATTFISPKRDLVGDEAIATAVRARLQCELGLSSQDLEAKVRQNVVSISASGLSDLQRRAVKCVVEGVPGATYMETAIGGD